jgi:hypothetical protein
MAHTNISRVICFFVLSTISNYSKDALHDSLSSADDNVSQHCFKNVALSVSIRHQQWLSYHLSVQPGQHTSNFLYSGDELSGKIILAL